MDTWLLQLVARAMAFQQFSLMAETNHWMQHFLLRTTMNMDGEDTFVHIWFKFLKTINMIELWFINHFNKGYVSDSLGQTHSPNGHRITSYTYMYSLWNNLHPRQQSQQGLSTIPSVPQQPFIFVDNEFGLIQNLEVTHRQYSRVNLFSFKSMFYQIIISEIITLHLQSSQTQSTHCLKS